MINNFIALDTETTGIRSATDRIIEVGMAKVVNGEVVEKYDELFNPGFHLPWEITNLTGIRDRDLKDCPGIAEKMQGILEFIGDYPILGHNISFDYRFLKKEAKVAGYRYEGTCIDTFKIAKRVLPTGQGKKLTELCEYFDIDPGHSHRAYDDAVSAMKLYYSLAELSPEEPLVNQAEIIHVKETKAAPITDAQKRFLSSLAAQHNLTLPKPLESYQKSEASREIDKILSTFGRKY